MLDAIEWLAEREGVEAEPSGAATTAAWLQEETRPRSGPAVLLVTGGNISPDTTALLNVRRQLARDRRP
jgi:threonine dehydratase